MESVTVTIGRNVGDEPMGADAWKVFGELVQRALADAGAEVWTDAQYTGSWEGVSEDARIFLAGADALDAHTLRRALGRIAGEFRQDAIGVSVGAAELVAPAPQGGPALART